MMPSSSIDQLLQDADHALQQHDFGRAKILFTTASRNDPANPRGPHGLALVAYRQHQFREAAAHFQDAITRSSRHVALHADLAACYNQLQEYGQAEVSARQALQLQPDHLPALNQLGVALLATQQWAAAQRVCEQLLQHFPAEEGLWYRLAEIDITLAHYPEALQRIDRLLALNPRHARAHAQRGFLLLRLQCFEASIAASDVAIQLEPTLAVAYLNKANALCACNRVAESMAACRMALERDPQCAEAHYDLATMLLLTGQFAEGWEEYEWRLRLRDGALPALASPRWDGHDAPGKTLLLLAEQGIGDTIQFIRYCAALKSRVGKVLLRVPSTLAPLMERCQMADCIVTSDDPLPLHDLHLPLMSAARICGADAATTRWQGPYLWPEPARAADWRHRLHAFPGPKIGLCWQGNPQHPVDARRSLPLAQLAPLTTQPGVTFISLQKGWRATPDAPSGAERIVSVAEWIETLEETLACIAQLDLVITVDTAIAHLAGALGTPTWLLLHTPGDWRWQCDTSTTAWYPSIRLFRQTTPRDWREVLHEISTALQSRYGRPV